jgi:tRNA 2-thiouridine synthesizing protein A
MIHDLDATGLLCPLPVLKARKRLMAIPAGERLRMRADDPAAIIDVPHFCAEAGYALIESGEDEGVQIYLIEKTA